MKPLETIAKNHQGTAETFVGQLHDDQILDVASFKELIQAINSLERSSKETTLARSVAKQIANIHSFTLNAIISHLDAKDYFNIKNYDRVNVRAFLERLNLSVESYYNGSNPPLKFDEDF